MYRRDQEAFFVFLHSVVEANTHAKIDKFYLIFFSVSPLFSLVLSSVYSLLLTLFWSFGPKFSFNHQKIINEW